MPDVEEELPPHPSPIEVMDYPEAFCRQLDYQGGILHVKEAQSALGVTRC